MAKEDLIELDGQVVEVMAGSLFKVQVIDAEGNLGHVALCYLGGKIRQNSIKIMLNDLVKIAVSPYDASRGKIIYRSK